MPVCYISLSNKYPTLTRKQAEQIRIIVARGLDSKSRRLDKNHIALRIQSTSRDNQLGDIELDIFAQLYLSRLFSRDKRANYISKEVSDYLGCCCATWINMCYVGYSRVDLGGKNYYSDSDNFIIRNMQKIRGINTHDAGNR